MIAPTDRGLTLGDGLFETLLVLEGEIQAFERHFARLTRSANEVGLPAPERDRVLATLVQALNQAALTTGRAALRLTYTAGSGGRGLDRPAEIAPLLFATASPAPVWQGAARLIVSTLRRNEGSPSSRLKTLSYIDNVLARREAAAAGVDEAVMLNNAGYVAGAAAANLFWLDGEVLCTPSVDCGALPGTMREQVIGDALGQGRVVREDRFKPEAVMAAQTVFLTNALIGRRPAICSV